MKITVLFGGPSAEREISLVSGNAVVAGLRTAGHAVTGVDVNPATIDAALDTPADVVFPVLHGAWGESGELQEILERRGVAFVGSGSAASRLGMNKAKTKAAWERAGLPTPPATVVTRENYDPSQGPCIAAPCVVKAIDSGSSIDVHICKTDPHAKACCTELLQKHGQALVEKFIDGIELTVGILEGRALHPIRITTTHEFFDYAAKYKGNDAAHHFDLQISDAAMRNVQAIALKAHQTVDARDLSRVDVMLDAAQNPYLLEINTLPGFTPKSLLPEMAAHEGIAFDQLVDRLARRAFDRGKSIAVATTAA